MQTATVNPPNTFTGISGCASLADLIQMECSILATRAVRIECGEKSGRIFFARGQVVHAEVGELAGEAALFEMLTWPGGHIVTADGVHPLSETIHRHWQRLIIAAAPAADRAPIAIRPRTFAGRRRR